MLLRCDKGNILSPFRVELLFVLWIVGDTAGLLGCNGEDGVGAEVMNVLFDDKIALDSLFGDGTL